MHRVIKLHQRRGAVDEWLTVVFSYVKIKTVYNPALVRTRCSFYEQVKRLFNIKYKTEFKFIKL